MAQPLVSIITPAYQARDFILRAVKSVLAQTYDNWEMIIVSDDLFDYQQHLHEQGVSDSRIRYASTGKVATGASHSRNTGLDHAWGDMIAFLDADDGFAPKRLEIMVPLALEKGVVLSNILFLDHATGNALENLSWPYPEKNVAEEDLPWVLLHTNIPFVYDRKHVAVTWDVQQRFMEDLLFVAELFDARGSVYYMPEPLYHYYRRQGSVCNSAEVAKRFLVAIDAMEYAVQRIKNAALRMSIVNYMRFLRAAELHYDSHVQKNPFHTFQDSLKYLLAHDYKIYKAYNG